MIFALFFSIFPVIVEYTYYNNIGFNNFVEFHEMHIQKIENDTVYYYLNRTSDAQYSSDFYRALNIINEDGEEYIVSNIALPSIVIPQGYEEFVATYTVEDLKPGKYYMEVEYTLNLKYGISKTLVLTSPIYNYDPQGSED